MTPLSRLEWEHIQQALAETEGNISAAARKNKGGQSPPYAFIATIRDQTTAPSSLRSTRSPPAKPAVVRGTKLSGPTFSHTSTGVDISTDE